jgi:hypothetical protein
MHNTRNLVLITGGSFLVLVVFFLIGLTLFTNNDTPVPSTPPVVEEETTLTPEAELALQEQIAPLIQAGDMTACEQVADDMYKKVCINNIALNKAQETNDISYCRYIDNELIPRADCEQQVVTTLSLEKEDPAICDQATDTEVKARCKESYHLALALKQNDPAPCTQAANPASCTDHFYLQQFTQDPDKVSCDAFSTPEAQADCATIKAGDTATDQQSFMRFCQAKESDLFTSLCFMMGNQTLPSQPLPDQQ